VLGTELEQKKQQLFITAAVQTVVVLGTELEQKKTTIFSML
jgi:hypothetical protein